MTDRPFSVTVDTAGHVAILRLSGEVNRFAADDLAAAFHAACQTGAGSVALDFESVSYLNSTGIALIVAILTEARTAGVAMVAWGVTDHYREIFEITRLVEFMHLYDDESTALAAD
jgi:anti-anti-sigma factor